MTERGSHFRSDVKTKSCCGFDWENKINIPVLLFQVIPMASRHVWSRKVSDLQSGFSWNFKENPEDITVSLSLSPWMKATLVTKGYRSLLVTLISISREDLFMIDKAVQPTPAAVRNSRCCLAVARETSQWWKRQFCHARKERTKEIFSSLAYPSSRDLINIPLQNNFIWWAYHRL